MEVFAPAKINFYLRIRGKRADGFHELDTVMVPVSLYDRLVIEPAKELIMSCSDSSLPTDDSNLVMKAARKLAQVSGCTQGASIHLEKNIPHGGGLGGGSSDAASVLMALNSFWKLGLTREQLFPIAAQLGSDVAFFLWGGWCRCLGRGEIVEPFPPDRTPEPLRIFLIIPPWPVPTPPVYKALKAPAFDSNLTIEPLTVCADTVIKAISTTRYRTSQLDWQDNGLTDAAQNVEPRLLELTHCLEELFPGRWRMSGSGAVHFVLPDDNQKATETEAVLQRKLTQPVRVLEAVTTASSYENYGNQNKAVPTQRR